VKLYRSRSLIPQLFFFFTARSLRPLTVAELWFTAKPAEAPLNVNASGVTLLAGWSGEMTKTPARTG